MSDKEFLREVKILFADSGETNFEVENSAELLDLLKKRKQELYQTQKQLEHLQQDLNSSKPYPFSQARLKRWKQMLANRQPHRDNARPDPYLAMENWKPTRVFALVENILQTCFYAVKLNEFDKLTTKLDLVKSNLTNWIQLLNK